MNLRQAAFRVGFNSLSLHHAVLPCSVQVKPVQIVQSRAKGHIDCCCLVFFFFFFLINDYLFVYIATTYSLHSISCVTDEDVMLTHTTWELGMMN